MATISEALAVAIENHQRGQLQAAEQIYRQILASQPDHADALHLLGVVSSQSGRHEVAIDYIERAIVLKRTDAAFHSNLGAAYSALRRIPEAIACFRRAVELNPVIGEAHVNLGNALKEQGNVDEAVACWRRALELMPNFAEVQNNLGIAFREQGMLDEAIACYRRALESMPNFAEAQNNLGVALKEQGNIAEAVVWYGRALDLKPGFAEAHYNLGVAQEELGDLSGAEERFRAALRHNSRFCLAHCKLAELLGGKLPEEDLAAQRRLLEDTSLPDAQRLLLHFGLAQPLDKRGEYVEAATHINRANAMQLSERRKSGSEYDPIEYEHLVTQMIASCGPDFFQRVRGFGLDSEIPIFVVGLPRSGTTLIEQILASHSQVFGAGEITLARDTMSAIGGTTAESIAGLRELDGPTTRRLASRHLERLCGLNPAAHRIVDKMPSNYFHLGLLAGLFPRSKLIHCRRDLRDVAVSCWMTHFRDVRWVNDPRHIASRFRAYQRMMEHWRQVLPVPVLEVDYEDTVSNLEGVARKLVDWCGLPWEPGCLDFYRAERPVSTASAVQVRQPLYPTSVGRWKHYEQSLTVLINAIPAGR